MTLLLFYAGAAFICSIVGTAIALAISESEDHDLVVCLGVGLAFGVLWPLFVFVFFPAKRLSKIIQNRVIEKLDEIEKEQNAS